MNMITHNISLDMLEPGIPPRIQVKQGDSMSRNVRITLLAGGEPWPVPEGAEPLIRYFAQDPESGEPIRGLYDTLPTGDPAWSCGENQLDILTVPQMFAVPGIVQTDVALRVDADTIATFNFEFYVNQAPANGTEPQAQDYYKIFTLEQLNSAITALQEWQVGADRLIAYLEHEVFELARIVHGA